MDDDIHNDMSVFGFGRRSINILHMLGIPGHPVDRLSKKILKLDIRSKLVIRDLIKRDVRWVLQVITQSGLHCVLFSIALQAIFGKIQYKELNVKGVILFPPYCNQFEQQQICDSC